MTTSKFLTRLILAVTAMSAGCTVSRTPAPPLQGPSELGLSLTLTANPDVLSMDGASQSQITIEAHDANGQLQPNVSVRAAIIGNGQPVDFGSLSARTVVTGSNGRATVTYTAPLAVPGSTPPTLSIQITPSGTDAANAVGRYVDIRLVPPGVITGGGPTASFTVSPATPTAFNDVLFDGSASRAALGSSIVLYSWEFGDGSAATGAQPHHRFTLSGTFHVVLRVTDNNGLSGTKSQDVVVGAGAGPRALFTFSPSQPVTNQTINYNGGLSTAGAGHSIVGYAWDFGNGTTASGITVTNAYAVAGSYSVTLTVTDDVGQTAQSTQSVPVTGAGTLTAAFSISPTDPHTGTVVNFNGGDSTTAAGTSITTYTWDFGDSSPTATGQTTTHTYTPPITRTFTARLTVTDTLGRMATVTKPVLVTVP